MGLVENILTFDNHSEAYRKYGKLKLHQKCVKQIVPYIVTSCVDFARPQNKGV